MLKEKLTTAQHELLVILSRTPEVLGVERNWSVDRDCHALVSDGHGGLKTTWSRSAAPRLQGPVVSGLIRAGALRSMTEEELEAYGERASRRDRYVLSDEGRRFAEENPTLKGYKPEHGEAVMEALRKIAASRAGEFSTASDIEGYTETYGPAAVQRALKHLSMHGFIRKRVSDYTYRGVPSGTATFALPEKDFAKAAAKAIERREQREEYHAKVRQRQIDMANAVREALGLDLNRSTARYFREERRVEIGLDEVEPVLRKLGLDVPAEIEDPHAGEED